MLKAGEREGERERGRTTDRPTDRPSGSKISNSLGSLPLSPLPSRPVRPRPAEGGAEVPLVQNGIHSRSSHYPPARPATPDRRRPIIIPKNRFPPSLPPSSTDGRTDGRTDGLPFEPSTVDRRYCYVIRISPLRCDAMRCGWSRSELSFGRGRSSSVAGG